MNPKDPIERWNDMHRVVDSLKTLARESGKTVYIEFKAPVVTPDPLPEPGLVVIDDFTLTHRST